MMSSVLLVCLALASAYALLWVRWWRARRLVAGLPSLPTLPIIGNIHQLTSNAETVYLYMEEASRVMAEKMKPFKVMVGPIPCVVISDIADVKIASNALLDKPYIYQFSRILAETGLISAPVHIWKHTSKKLAGAFSNRVVANYQNVFNAHAQKLVGELRGEAGGAAFDVMRKYIVKTTLDAINDIVVGKHDPESRQSPVYYRAYNRIWKLLSQRARNPFLHFDCLYRLTSSCQEFEKCVDIVTKVSLQAITNKKKEREEMHKNNMMDKNEDSDMFKSYLDILLELSETDSFFTEKHILMEMNTIIIAGHDTLTKALSICLLLIGKRKDVQDKLYAEMKGIFGDSKRPVEKEDLALMRYCEAVINESLRLYPPVPGVLRKADRDLELSSCTIPKGTGCCLFLWGSGRSTRMWGADAEQFRPERWLQRDYSKDAVLVAFSYGKRVCIGQKYAMAFLKTLLAHCVRELEFETEAKKMRVKIDILMTVTEGKLLKVHDRDGSSGKALVGGS